MTPSIPEGFLKDLKLIDGNLHAVWSPSLQVFCIFYKNPNGKTFKVTEVCDEDGKRLPLDNRILDKLRRWDTSKIGMSADEIAKRQYDNYFEASLKQKKKKREEQKYKAKQLTTWWSRVADKLIDTKRYSELPMKPYIQKKLNANQQLVNQFGMPHLTGTPKII